MASFALWTAENLHVKLRTTKMTLRKCDLNTNAWSLGPALPVQVTDFAMVSFGTFILVSGASAKGIFILNTGDSDGDWVIAGIHVKPSRCSHKAVVLK